MTDVFCDWNLGSDESGDGSEDKPFKTITMASTGRNGNDHIKCAKSPDDVLLDLLMTWTHGSAIINTSSDPRGMLNAGNLIRKQTLHLNDFNAYWEISHLTQNSIVLQGYFNGQTEKDVLGIKIGVTDTYAAATPTSYVQEVKSPGTDYSSMLIVSGGWDLEETPPTRTGKTVFWQSGANRYGYGIVCYNKNFIKLVGIDVARYNIGHYMYNGRGIYLDGCKNIRSNSYNINFASDNGCWAKDCVINGGALNASNTSAGIYMDNVVFLQGSPSHLSADILEMQNCKFLSTAPFNGYAMGTNVLVNNCDLSAVKWMYHKGSCGQKIINTKINEILCGSTWPKEIAGSNTPCLIVKNYNTTPNDDRIYFTQGYIKSGSYMEWIPNDMDWPLRYGICGIPAEINTERTVKFSLKKTDVFNGLCQAALFCLGMNLTDWIDMQPTNEYAEKILIAPAVYMTQNGSIEFQLKVTGTTGSILLNNIKYNGEVKELNNRCHFS